MYTNTQMYNVPHSNYMPYPTQVNRAYNYDMGNMNYDNQDIYYKNYYNNNGNIHSLINQTQSAYMNIYAHSQMMPMIYYTYPDQQQLSLQMTNRQFYYNTSTHQPHLQPDICTNNHILPISHPTCPEHFHQSSPPVITNTLRHQSVPMFSQHIFYEQSQPMSSQQSQPVSYQKETYITQQNDIRINESTQSQNIFHNLNNQQVNSNNDIISCNNTTEDINNESVQNQKIDNLDVQQVTDDNSIILSNTYITEDIIATRDSTQEVVFVKNTNTITETAAIIKNDLQNDVKVEQSVDQNTDGRRKEKKILNNVQTIIMSNGPMSNASSHVSESKITKSEPETLPKQKKSYANFFKKNEPLSICKTTNWTTTGNSSNENNNGNNKNGSFLKKTTSIKNTVKPNIMLNSVLEDEHTLKLGGKYKRFTF